MGAIADTPANLKSGSGEGNSATAKRKTEDGIPLNKSVPAGRWGTMFEIGMAVVFVAVSEYINAETITVDGGWWLGTEKPFPSRGQLEQVTKASEAKSRALQPSASSKL